MFYVQIDFRFTRFSVLAYTGPPKRTNNNNNVPKTGGGPGCERSPRTWSSVSVRDGGEWIFGGGEKKSSFFLFFVHVKFFFIIIIASHGKTDIRIHLCMRTANEENYAENKKTQKKKTRWRGKFVLIRCKRDDINFVTTHRGLRRFSVVQRDFSFFFFIFNKI